MSRDTLKAAMKHMEEALSWRWKHTREDEGYIERCKTWIKLRKMGSKKADRVYEEIFNKYDFPPMKYLKDLQENFKEQHAVFYSMMRSKRYVSYNEKHPYVCFSTFHFLSNSGREAVLRVRGFSEGTLLSHEAAESDLKFKEPSQWRNTKARTMRIDINLMYPTKQIIAQLSNLIEGFTDLKNSKMYQGKIDGKIQRVRIRSLPGMFIYADEPRFRHLGPKKRPDDYKENLDYFRRRKKLKPGEDVITLLPDHELNNQKTKSAARRKVNRKLHRCEEMIENKECRNIR